MSRRPRVIRKFTAENFSFIFIVRIVRLQFVFCVAGNCTIRLTIDSVITLPIVINHSTEFARQVRDCKEGTCTFC